MTQASPLALALVLAAGAVAVTWRLRPAAGPGGQAGVFLLTADPGMRFSERVPGPALRVRAGQRVRVVLANRDSLAHDLWVVGAEERAPYLEPAFPGARTRLVGPGERDEIHFTPTRPGRYRYVCTVPGHDSTMFGEFLVEQERGP